MSTMQYWIVLQKMKSEEVDGQECLQLVQHLWRMLRKVFRRRVFTRKASSQELQELLHIIVLVMVEPGVDKLPAPYENRLFHRLADLTLIV